ncbi:MAG TPA: DUF3016 domain-containing protein [Dokdonella sp.]|uniref:DUF3016 domain-containing protein n=1 Tax=Dokdonella sp. TaxID=2291710 RepID=UPI002BFC4E31|nr:DUF3016 domain-containing protein [Dokdonella sp.]HOX72034.1 DUF3016 domain-containing protein [Dokdonella sp.]
MLIQRTLKDLIPGLALAAFLIGAPALAQAGEAKGDSARVSVAWTDPAAFTELRYGHQFRQPKPEAWLAEFRKTLVRRADSVLQPGQHLDVTITDVKLAGQFEPWLGADYRDVRIVKSIYPPHINLTFNLTDANGQVIASGERKLRDPAFLDRGTVNPSESYRFEKRMLKDWVAREFGRKDA